MILGHQNLVRTQKALVTQQILEVAVVEGCRRDKVQGKQVLIAAGLRAPRPQLGCVRLIQAQIWLCVSCLVVQPLSEAYASCISYGVTSCNNSLYISSAPLWKYWWDSNSINVPDNATRSTRLSPCSLNLVRIVWKVLFGAGMLLFEPLKLAPLESLLPRGTTQLGPPACTDTKNSRIYEIGFRLHALTRRNALDSQELWNLWQQRPWYLHKKLSEGTLSLGLIWSHRSPQIHELNFCWDLIFSHCLRFHHCLTVLMHHIPSNQTNNQLYRWWCSRLENVEMNVYIYTLTKQSWKWSLRSEAAMRGSLATAFATMDLTISWACGHVRS